MQRRLFVWMLGLVGCSAALCAEDTTIDALNLEAHGFASFGYLRTFGNNWLEDNTSAGTTDLWEAAINAIARPTDRLRIGAQLFNRKLGKFDDGRPMLDWAYADYRFADAVGLQVGRVKFPVGLYNEMLDVDAARAPVLLPPAIYEMRARDIFISVDGAKAYGSGGYEPGWLPRIRGLWRHQALQRTRWSRHPLV